MSQEYTPLLTNSKNPNVFPPFQAGGGGRQQPPVPYQTVEIIPDPCTNTTRRFSSSRIQQGGIASVSIVSVIALGVAVVLLVGVTFTVPNEQQVLSSVLRQNAPDANSDPGYKDITIPQGRLRGFTKKSRQGRDYTAYYKVPYAEPPLGELRFKDPVAPRTTWTGLRSTPVVATQCIQKEKYSDVDMAVGDEDCLYANIYVPSTSNPGPLPTMVYVHGGGFTDGNGSRYGADYFMDEDVVLITFQFRLGPFGFLNTQDDVIHGNMGLKDQVQMLKWTKENVAHFGGDPDVVTIFGNSGGGISVGFLMLSPMANGLFHRAITQSGANVCASVQAGGLKDDDPLETVREVGRILNCDAGNTTSFLECLKIKTASEIALVRTRKTIYGISIENRDDDQVYMPDLPYNVLKTNPNKVPYIVGVVNAEWTGQGLALVQNEDLCKNLNDDFAGSAGELLNVDASESELLSVRDLYFGDKVIGNDTLREAIDLSSDRGMIHCSYVSAKMHAEFNPAYLYYLSKPPAKSYAEKAQPGFPAKEMGLVSHADELQYFFLYDGYPEIPEGDPEYYEFSKYVVKQWATFARDGAPSSDWEQVHPLSSSSSTSSEATFWFELNDSPQRTEVIRDRMDLWDRFSHKQLKYE